MGVPAATAQVISWVPPWLKAATAFLWTQLSSSAFWLGLGVPSLLLILFLRRRAQGASVSFGLPFGLGSVTFDLTPGDRILAWKLYVQLVTRKAALPFDRGHDTVSDVLDSLHELFRVARDLLSELPPKHFRKEGGVAVLVIRVLNDGLRPPLTKWQSDYRRWWLRALDEPANRDRSPLEVQRSYPMYDDLLKDLEFMNTELSKLADELSDIAAGKPARAEQKVRPKPAAPAPPPAGLPPVATPPPKRQDEPEDTQRILGQGLVE